VKRRAPRPIALVLAGLSRRLEPPTPLARAQGVWEAAVGPAVAAHCSPVGERGGVLTVACDEAVWAAELDLMGPELVARLAAELGRAEIASLRVRVGRE
jgi:predicted nucleic acid-binding Zn ribbon protein